MTMMSHPLIVEPNAPMEAWTVDTVAYAFEAGLDEQVQPVGIAFGAVQPGPVVY
jgi:hypothetical protein